MVNQTTCDDRVEREVWLTVIGGKAVNDVQVLPESILVLLGAENRSHLRSSLADPRDVILTKEQVMWTHFARDGQTFLLCHTDDGNLKNKGKERNSRQAQLTRQVAPPSSHLLLPGYVADMDGFLVELCHEDDSCRGPTFSVHTYWSSLWPLGKMLHSEG